MIYFFIYLLLETLISVEVSSQIGGLNTFLSFILTAFVGVLIFKNFKQNMFSTLKDFQAGGIDVNQLKSRNIFPLLGAILLIIPGFMTDFIGVLFQLSIFTDLLVKKGFKNSNFEGAYQNKPQEKYRESFQNHEYKQGFKYDENIIDVETKNENENNKELK